MTLHLESHAYVLILTREAKIKNICMSKNNVSKKMRGFSTCLQFLKINIKHCDCKICYQQNIIIAKKHSTTHNKLPLLM